MSDALLVDCSIELPFRMDFCARGPDVAPLQLQQGDYAATLFFPPSLGDQTDGMGIFGEWAWWTGRTLRLALERDLPDLYDEDLLRDDAEEAAQTILSRFLRACRLTLEQPEILPILLDSRTVSLSIRSPHGQTRALPEPSGAFFYQTLPDQPPLERSINDRTLPDIINAMSEASPVLLQEQIELDIRAFEKQGEIERAEWLRSKLSEERALAREADA